MKKGFTLIEVMIASVLLVSFMGAYLGTYRSFMSSAQQSKALYQALSSCFSKFEEISGHEFGMIVADYNTTPGNTFDILDNFGNKMGKGLIEVTYAGTNNWTQATASANWNPRYVLTSLVYDNKMWIMGGDNGSAYKDDVWYSTNGTSWTNATNSANWSARFAHSSLVYDNKMWIMGGVNQSAARKNDVWYSVDGKTWYNATLSANWTPRYGHTALVYDNKMWVMGGDNGSVQRDIWYSSNGVDWTNATNVNWGSRMWFGALVYDNKMWVMGGYNGTYGNDVWWTNDTNLTDGQTWTPATPSANWEPRHNFTALVYDNKMWIMGGDNGSAYKDDVWYSTNGANWTKSRATILTPRKCHTALVYDNKVWVMGGFDTTWRSDVGWSTGGNRLLNVSILASFRTPNNRTTGEDRDLDGVLDAGEDTLIVNGRLDSPVQLRVLVSERKGATFLGRPQK